MGGVVTVVNIAVLVLRKDRADVPHFHTPTIMAVLGAITGTVAASVIARARTVRSPRRTPAT